MTHYNKTIDRNKAWYDKFRRLPVRDHYQLTVLLLVASVFGVLLAHRILDNNQQSYSMRTQASRNSVTQFLLVNPGNVHGFVTGEVLVKFKDTTAPARAREVMTSNGLTQLSEITPLGIKVFGIPRGQEVENFSERLSQNPNVEFAEPNYIFAPAFAPNDPKYPNQNALQKIQIAGAWDRTTGRSDMVIAVCDTGVEATHEDLSAKVLPGWNLYDGNSDSSDVFGHGTSVAGAAGAATDNGVGVAAPAWMPRILPVRVSSVDGTATASALAGCLSWAVDHGAKVVNVSYNISYIVKRNGSKLSYSENRTATTAAKYVRNKGGLVVAAAGNAGQTEKPTISDNPYIMAVGATDRDTDVIKYYSVQGKFVDVVAPVDVTTPCLGNQYCGAGGTSYAAPQVSGVAALVWSVNPSFTPAQIESIIEQTVDDLGTPGLDSTYGWGRLNAAGAVNQACSFTGSVCD